MPHLQMRPVRSAVAINARALSRSCAIGFSTNTSQPNSINLHRPSSACVIVGVAIIAASDAAATSSGVVNSGQPRSSAMAAARSASVSRMPERWTSGSSCRMRTWFLPKEPAPRRRCGEWWSSIYEATTPRHPGLLTISLCGPTEGRVRTWRDTISRPTRASARAWRASPRGTRNSPVPSGCELLQPTCSVRILPLRTDPIVLRGFGGRGSLAFLARLSRYAVTLIISAPTRIGVRSNDFIQPIVGKCASSGNAHGTRSSRKRGRGCRPGRGPQTILYGGHHAFRFYARPDRQYTRVCHPAHA